MIPSQIVIGHRMVGSVIPDTLLASLIIIQMSRAGFVPLTLTQIYSVQGSSRISCQTLQISFESVASLRQRSASRTLFLTAGLRLPSLTGNGATTQGLTNTFTTCMSALRKKLTFWVSFFRYLC